MPITGIKLKSLAARPPQKDVKVTDGRGLFLLATAKGGLYWRMRYRFQGRQKDLALGVYPQVTLQKARSLCEEARNLLAQGVDPAARKKWAKERLKAAASGGANTFENIALEWAHSPARNWTDSHRHAVIRRLELHVFPYIGKKPANSLKAADYLEPIKQAARLGIVDTARRLAGYCFRIGNYAVNYKGADNNMATGLASELPAVKSTHYPAISNPDRLGKLLADIDRFDGGMVVKSALKILPYIFLRSRELRGARWAEIDFENHEWTVPAERMKKRRMHKIPMPVQVEKILRELHPFTGSHEYVFYSGISRHGYISSNTLRNGLTKIGYGKDQLCIHGFRTAFSTNMNELGQNPDVIEACLSHAENNAVRAAYNRALYWRQRREAMQFWADWLDGLKSNGGINASQYLRDMLGKI